MDRAAAAGAAVTDSVETPEHRILEKGVVDVSAVVFGLENRHRFLGRDPARLAGMMFNDKTGKGLPHHQTDIQRQAGIRPGRTTGTIQRHQMLGIFQHNRAGAFVRDDLLQIGESNLLVDPHQFPGFPERQSLAMISIRQANRIHFSILLFAFGNLPSEPGGQRSQFLRQRMPPGAERNVEIGPTPVQIAMQRFKKRNIRRPARLGKKFSGGRFNQAHSAAPQSIKMHRA